MITTKGRYGLRVIPDLAAHREDGFVPLKDIAQRQEISKKYLEIIIKKMVDTGWCKASAARAAVTVFPGSRRNIPWEKSRKLWRTA